MMSHHIGAALADEHRKTLLAQAEAAGIARQARLHRRTATRSRATVTAGVAAIAALLGGTAAAVVAAPASTPPRPQYQGAPPAPSYDPAQLATQYQDAAPGPQYDAVQLTTRFDGTQPTVQLTAVVRGAPGPTYDG